MTYSVLYVDDEPALLSLTKTFLEQDGTLAIDTCSSGREALHRIEGNPYDAIVSDYEMPEMDGITLLKSVKLKKKDLPFIIFTGRGREHVVIEALNYGADFYLQKGGDPRSMFAELKNVIEAAARHKHARHALSESTELFEAISKRSNDAIVLLDDRDELVFCNPAWEAMTGFTESDFAGKKFHTLVAPQLDPARHCAAAKVFYHDTVSANSNRVIEVSGTRKTGDPMILELSIAPLVLNGRHHVVGIGRDITERKRIDEDIRRTAQRLAVLNEVILNGSRAQELPVFLEGVVNATLRFMKFDAGGVYLIDEGGTTATLACGVQLGEEFEQDVRIMDARKPPHDQLFIRGEPVFSEKYEERLPELSAKYHILSMTGIPFIGKKGVIGVLNLASRQRHTFTEEEKTILITIGCELGGTIERLIAEEHLRLERENLAALTECMDDMVSVLDSSGKILDVNPAVTRNLGYRKEDLIGMDVVRLTHPEHREKALGIVQDLTEGKRMLFSFPVMCRDGRQIHVETRMTKGTWDGKTAYFGVSRDVTVRSEVEEVLRQSEDRFRSLIHNSVDMVVMADLTGNICYYNPATEKILGYPAGTWENHNVMEFVHPEDHRIVSRELGEVFRGINEHNPTEFRLRHADGSWVPVEAVGDRIRSGGNSDQVVITIRDVTRRKAAEEAIRQSERLLDSVFSSIQHPMSVLDPDMNIVRVNEVTRNCYRSELPLEGKKCYEVFNRYGKPCSGCPVLITLQTGKPASGAVEVIPGDGEIYRCIEIFAYPMKDPLTETLTGVVEFARDITDQKQAARRLEESEQKYRQLFESLHNPVVMFDVETMQIRDANAAVTEQYGYTHEELLRMKVPDLSAEPEKTRAALRDISLGNVYDVPFRYQKRKDGHVFPAQIAKGIMTLDGHRYCISVIHDLSQRIILEKALKDQADKLAQYSRDLAQANRKLNLVGEVSRHSIANKLAVLCSSLDLMKSGGAGGDASRYLSEMERAADSIQKIIAFEKEFGQIGTKNPEWLDLREVISHAAEDFPFNRVHLEQENTALEIFADPLLEKAFHNLFDNAFRHGGTISRISVACRNTYEGIVISFGDDGCGIPYADKERIFERGFGKNTGFGLFLIREILGITDITIRECGMPQKGARFELVVPEGSFRAVS